MAELILCLSCAFSLDFAISCPHMVDHVTCTDCWKWLLTPVLTPLPIPLIIIFHHPIFACDSLMHWNPTNSHLSEYLLFIFLYTYAMLMSLLEAHVIGRSFGTHLLAGRLSEFSAPSSGHLLTCSRRPDVMLVFLTKQPYVVAQVLEPRTEQLFAVQVVTVYNK
jgi:hypothetical protein